MIVRISVHGVWSEPKILAQLSKRIEHLDPRTPEVPIVPGRDYEAVPPGCCRDVTALHRHSVARLL